MQIGQDGDDEFDTILATQAVSRVARVVESLAKQGYKQTSGYRGPALNAKVLGAYFSQHRAGTAADFAVNPGQVPAFVAAARAEGLRAVNEMSRPGHGPHMHVQMYRAGQTPQRLFQGVGAVQITQVP